MLQDSKLLVSGAISGVDNSITPQTVTGTGNVLSTNTIDLLQNRDIGEGNTIFCRSVVGAAQAGSTSVEIQVITTDDAALSVNLVILASSGAIPVANLTAGALIDIALPPRPSSKGQRYLGVRYVITGTSTAGSFTTDFGLEIIDSKKFYPSGFAIK